jgi:uncharacterized protein YndB with AHSA1/START domain
VKVARIVIGGLVGLVLLVVAVGAALPREHVATMTTTVTAPADSVWRVLTDPAAYPAWRADVQRVDLLPAGGAATLAWREHTSQGGMSLVADSLEPPRRMVARILDEGQPFGGTWEYGLSPDSASAGRTRVTITERGWVSNPIFRFVSRFVFGHHRTLDIYLRALSRRFGPEVAPTRG